jgi:AbrB family looped-hinge helix DNA binding protein
MKVTGKGQITIPQAVRNRYWLQPGTEVEVVARGEEALIRPRKARKGDAVTEWVGRFAGSGTVEVTTEEIMRMTRGEE